MVRAMENGKNVYIIFPCTHKHTHTQIDTDGKLGKRSPVMLQKKKSANLGKTVTIKYTKFSVFLVNLQFTSNNVILWQNKVRK